MAQIFLYYLGICNQVDSLWTMDSLSRHVEGSTGSLAHVAWSPFLGDRAEREISPLHTAVCVPVSVSCA